VALQGERLYLGEWEGVHTLERLQGEVIAVSVSLHNRGRSPLSVELSFSDDSFTPESSAVEFQPEMEVVTRVQVSTRISQGRPAALLQITTNDPDSTKVELLFYDDFGGGLHAVDTVDYTFELLDPTGDNDIEDLREKVRMLTNFMMF
jgi:hypothetical protein